jgi:hypothetical protein
LPRAAFAGCAWGGHHKDAADPPSAIAYLVDMNERASITRLKLAYAGEPQNPT